MQKLILLFYSCLAVFSLHSQGFQVNFQGQKQQGMGLAGTALSEDASALFYNPGGVAFVGKNEVNAGFSPIFANTLFVDSASGEGYRTESPMGTPFSAYALLGFKKMESLKVGLAVYTPFGSTIQYEDAWIGRFALTKLSLRSIYFQPTVSYRINEHLGFGAGFIISTGSVNLQKDIPVQFADGAYGHAELTGKALGFGYNLGLNAKVNEHFSLGLTYRSKVSMKVKEGDATFTVPESLSANFPDGPFSSSLELPGVLTLGASYDSGKKWQFVLDINYVGWKVYDTLAFDYESNTASLVDTKSAREYKDIIAIRGGVNFKATEMIDVRLGGGYGFTPVRSGYVTPESPDGNRIYGTAGLGFKFNEHFNADLSFYYTYINRTDRNLESNLSGTFTTIAISPGIGLSYKW